MSATGTKVTRRYSNFRGVDFRGEEISLQRSPDCLNVWKDYKKTDSIRTRPGMEFVEAHDAPIYGIYFYKGEMIVHSGKKLYKGDTSLYEGVAEAPSNAFVYEGVWYFMDGKHYLRYDGEKIEDVVGYVPTTSIARKPITHWPTETFTGNGEQAVFNLPWGKIDGMVEINVTEWKETEEGKKPETTTIHDFLLGPVRIDFDAGTVTFVDEVGKEKPPANGAVIEVTYIKYHLGGGGTTHEDVNMISSHRINTFLADGESEVFCLDTTDIDEIVTVEVNDKVVERVKAYDEDGEEKEVNYTVNLENGYIAFTEAPGAPLTDGQDNVKVTFKKAVEGHQGRILGCTMLQVFDNRVFVSGNPECPNTVWHCSLNDPTYFSDTDYYKDGLDSAKVKGIVAGNDALWVFREPSDANTTVFYHRPVLDGEYGKVYPSSHSSISTGCVGKAINFNDDIVFFSERGMEGRSGDITTEQAVAHRSSLVDPRLTAGITSEEGRAAYENMILEEWEGYLLVFIGNKAYLADSRTAFAHENHIEYEWFYWEMEKPITCARVYGGILYLGAEGSVYTLTDTECDLESFWTTPKDKFQAPNKVKTTNKKGCVVEAVGDVTVSAKTENGEYEDIDTYTGVTDYFACRVKKKKFKDLQLKFYSDTRFSLEAVTLEAIVGGYIKR